MNDMTIRAIFAGIASVVFKGLSDMVCRFFIFSDISMVKVAAGTFISLGHFTVLGLLIGIIAHYTIGGIIGFLFYLFLKVTNHSYPIIKGVFAGLVVWLFLAGMLLRFGISEINPNDEGTNFMLLIDHLVFGLSLGILTKKFVLK